MKRLCLTMTLLAALLLSGCADRSAEKNLSELSRQLSEAESLSFSAQVHAQFPDKIAEFSLRYAGEGEEQVVSVRRPEAIAGIRARVSGSATRLEYEGLVLDMGELDRYGLSPLSALPVLVEALRTGHLDSSWQSQGMQVVELVLDDHVRARVHFQPEGFVPCYAELLSDGQVRVFFTISDWSLSHERSAKEKLGGDQSAQYPP